MTKLVTDSLRKLVMLLKKGFSLREVKARLEEEGVHTSKTSPCLLLKKYRETGSVVERLRARVPKKLTNQHYVFIDQCLENDDVHAQALTWRECSSSGYSRLRLCSNSACGGGVPVICGEHEKQLHIPPWNGSVDLYRSIPPLSSRDAP